MNGLYDGIFPILGGSIQSSQPGHTQRQLAAMQMSAYRSIMSQQQAHIDYCMLYGNATHQKPLDEFVPITQDKVRLLQTLAQPTKP